MHRVPSSHRARPSCHGRAAPAVVESLEPRQLLSAAATVSAAVVGVPVLRGNTVVFQGFATNDTVSVTYEGGGLAGRIAVTVNGHKTLFDARAVRRLDLRLGGGNDTLTINLPAGLRLLPYAYGEDGNDTMSSNFPASLDGGPGDDTLNGSPWGDRLIGGPGNDTLRSNGGRDILRAGPGRDRVVYANGDVDIGFLRLRTDRTGRLNVLGTRGDDRFVFSREGTTGRILRVTLGEDSALFDVDRLTALRVDGGAGRDEIIQQPPGLLSPGGLLGNKPFSTRSIEVL